MSSKRNTMPDIRLGTG